MFDLNRWYRWDRTRRLIAAGGSVVATLAMLTGTGGAQTLSPLQQQDHVQVIAQQVMQLDSEPYGWFVSQHVIPAQGLKLNGETGAFLLSNDSSLLVEGAGGPLSVLDAGEAMALTEDESLALMPVGGESTTVFEFGLRPYASAMADGSMTGGAPIPNVQGLREIEVGREVLRPSETLTIDSPDASALLMITHGEVEVSGTSDEVLGAGTVTEVADGATLLAGDERGATIVTLRIGEAIVLDEIAVSGGNGDSGSGTGGNTVPTIRFDSDGDGLYDDEEAIYGSDPTNPDTDQDTLSDGDEVNLYGSDPTSMDGDGDGLPDYNEVMQWGTDPSKPDTDGDGINDHDELSYGTELLVADTDGDGLVDGDELVYQTDPFNDDSDNDGLSDGEEVSFGTNPLAEDTDGDGQSDSDELMFGSDPTDPNSKYVGQN